MNQQFPQPTIPTKLSYLIKATVFSVMCIELEFLTLTSVRMVMQILHKKQVSQK